MKILTKLPTLRRKDGSLKQISTAAYTPKDFHRVFFNQAIPLLAHFANNATRILLYLMFNADGSNMVFCTYDDIMRDCSIHSRTTIADTLRELDEMEAVIKVSNSRYMINPALIVKGNRDKFHLIANEFNIIAERRHNVRKEERKEI